MTPSLWIMKPQSVIHKAVCRSPVIHKPPCPTEHVTSAGKCVRKDLANNHIRPDEATKAQSKVKQKAKIQKPLATHAAGHPGFGLVANSSGRWCWQRKN